MYISALFLHHRAEIKNDSTLESFRLGEATDSRYQRSL